VNLSRRGPDITGDITIPVSDEHELHLMGTVLRMRGRITPQPFTWPRKHTFNTLGRHTATPYLVLSPDTPPEKRNGSGGGLGTLAKLLGYADVAFCAMSHDKSHMR
jgi:hypothetical protein